MQVASVALSFGLPLYAMIRLMGTNTIVLKDTREHFHTHASDNGLLWDFVEIKRINRADTTMFSVSRHRSIANLKIEYVGWEEPSSSRGK